MRIEYLDALESVNAWWISGQTVVANLLGTPGIKVYDTVDSKERLINTALTFACGGGTQMLCYKPKAHDMYMVNSNANYSQQLIPGVKYAFKCVYVDGRFFVLAYEADPAIRNWYCIDDRLDNLKIIRHNPEYELSFTSNCVVGWAYDRLSFFQDDDLTSQLFELKISRDLKIDRATPFQFKYIGLGTRTLVIYHDRSKQVFWVDLENGLVVQNLANCIYLNAGLDEDSVYFLDLAKKVIYRYEEQAGLSELRSIPPILSKLHSGVFTTQIIAETPLFFMPDSQIFMLTLNGELVSLTGPSLDIGKSAVGLLSAPTVKLSSQGLLGVRFGQDAYSPISVYRIHIV